MTRRLLSLFCLLSFLSLIPCACAPLWDKPGATFREDPLQSPSITLPPETQASPLPSETKALPAVSESGEATTESTAASTEEDPLASLFHTESMSESLKNSLQEAFAQYLASRGLENAAIGFAFQDLLSGASISYQGGRRFEAASTVKLPAVFYTWEEVEAGTCRLDELMTVEEEDLELGQGAVSAGGVGAEFPLETLLHEAIIQSDNTANLMLFRFWQDRCPERWLIYAFDRRYGISYENDRSFSAAELLPMLNRLWQKKDGPGVSRLLADMQATTFSPMAALYLNAPVARKYGKLGGLYHDIGLCLSAQPFSFSVFTADLPFPEDTIGNLVRLFADGLAAEPAGPRG